MSQPLDPLDVNSPQNQLNARNGYAWLLGQVFHASVAMVYTGLGILVGSSQRARTPDGGTWIGLFGLALLLGGFAWMAVLRGRRTSGA